VNATGNVSDVFLVQVNASSNQTFVPQNVSANATIQIVSPVRALAVVNLSPVTNGQFLINESVNITINASSQFSISAVTMNVTLPDGTVVMVQLLNQSQDIFNLTWLNLTQRGRYNITVFANDSAGATTTVTYFFVRRAFNVIDAVEQVTNNFVNYTVSVYGNASGELNLTLFLNRSTVQFMNVTNVREDSVSSVLRIGQAINESDEVFSALSNFSIDLTDMNFSTINVTATAVSGNLLFTCKNFNRSLEECTDLCANGTEDGNCPAQPNGLWTFVREVTPGQQYTLLFTNATDPGFGEFSSAQRAEESNTSALGVINTLQLNFTPVAFQQLIIGYGEFQGNSNISGIRAQFVLNETMGFGNYSWQPDTGRTANPPGDYVPMFAHDVVNLTQRLQNISVQYFSSNASVPVFVRRARAIALDVRNGDAAMNESNATQFQQLTPAGAFQNIANVSYRPLTAMPLLVIASAEVLANSTTQSVSARLLHNNTEISFAEIEGSNASDIELFAAHVLVNATANVTQNFTVQGRSETTANKAIRNARVTVVPLRDVFFNATALNTVSTSVVQRNATNLSFTLNTAADVIIIATADVNISSATNGNFIGAHVTVDGLTIGNMTQGAADATDDYSFITVQQLNLTAGTHVARIGVNRQAGSGGIVNMRRARITVIPIVNNAPFVENLTLISASGQNQDGDNLTLFFNSSDLDGDNVKNITNWFVQNESAITLNMPFEGGSNQTFTRDYSPFGRNGTVDNATWLPRGGYDGFGAYEFLGVRPPNGFIRGIPNQSINRTTGSIEVWARPNTFDGQQMLVWAGEAAGNGYGPSQELHLSVNIFNATRNQTGFTFFYGDGDAIGNMAAGQPDDNFTYVFSQNLTPDQYYHVVVTWDLVNLNRTRMYVNGTLLGEDNTTGDPLYDTSLWQDSLHIGRPEAGGTPIRMYNGTLDDVRIWNRALTEEQIYALANNRSQRIVAEETVVGDVWGACVTPNDRLADGTTGCSNNLTIVAAVTLLNTSNLTVNKLDFPDSVFASTLLTYQINVTSSGNGTAFNITVNDVYPPQVIFKSASPQPLAGTNNTFVVGNLSAGANFSINITVQVDNITNGVLINNTAIASFQNETSQVFVNATATQSTTVYVGYIFLNFTPPTPDTNNITVDGTLVANVTINSSLNMSRFLFSWNGTNYTLYNNSLVLMFNFDNVSALGENNTRVADVGRRGNDGQVLGGAVPIASGRYGGAFDFDGIDDRIRVLHNESLNISSKGTWVYWVYLRDNDSGCRAFASKRDTFNVNNNWGMGINFAGSGDIRFEYSITGTEHNFTNFTPALPVNTWLHFAFVFNANDTAQNARLYLNGVEVPAAYAENPNQPINGGTSDIYFGAVNNGSACRLNGSMDEVRIWDTALSAAEIQQHYFSNLQRYNATFWTYLTNQSKNATAELDPGLYDYFACGNDYVGRENCTETRRMNITRRFTLVNLSPVTNAQYLLNETVNLSVNVTSRFSIGQVVANITLPNGTIITVRLFNQSQDIFNFTWLNMTQRGRYNITFYANDTQGGANASFGIFFVRRPLNVIDVTEIINDSFIDYTVSIYGNASRVLNFTLFVNRSTVRFLNVTNHREDSPNSIIRVGQAINDSVPYPEATNFSIDAEQFNFQSINVTATSFFDKVYKCPRFNRTTETCIDLCANGTDESTDCAVQFNGLWELIANTSFGANFTFLITNATDPGFSGYNSSQRENESNTTSTTPAVGTQANFTPTATQQFLLLGYAELQGAVQTADVRAQWSLNDSLHVGNLSYQSDTSRTSDPPGDYEPFFSHRTMNVTLNLQNLTVSTSAESGQTTFSRRVRAIALGINTSDGQTNESSDNFMTLSPANTFLNITNLSITPSVTQRILIIASAEMTPNSTTQSVTARLLMNGTEIALAEREGDATSDIVLFATHLVINATANVTQNFTLQARAETATNKGIRRARISAIPLSEVYFNQSEANSTTTSNTPQNKTVLNFSLAADQSVLVIASADTNIISATDGNFIGAHLSIDGEPQGNMTVGARDVTDDFSFVTVRQMNLSAGTHSARITFRREAGSVVTVQMSRARITVVPIAEGAPDIFVNASEINFNVSHPSENENITINATVRNIGTAPATNVLVQFFDMTGSRTQINGNLTIASLPAGGAVVVNVSYITIVGNRSILVAADPFNTIVETNETNNNATRQLNVQAWTIYFGKSRGNLSLDATLESRSQFSWNHTDAGFVYFFDTDSNFSLLSLQALGRNTTNGTAVNDFGEADVNLNMTGFNDSVVVLFTGGSNSTPNETRNLTIFGRLVGQVPVLNSTNVGTFITGILWDTADDTNGQYDITDKEDLVFVGNLNVSKSGASGTNIDYEVRVPSLIRSYKPTVNQTAFIAEHG
jgi:hypothetical protein